jgi:multidrug efflux pump subunit AcrA (membrane-fusion protein)
LQKKLRELANSMKISFKNGFGMVIALAVAIVVAVTLVKSKTPLEHVAVEMPSRSVEVVSAGEIPFRSRVTAYGNVEPAITLHSMAELSGKISYVHPNLKSGETIPAGTLVVRIEAEDYALSLKQTEEDLKAGEAELARVRDVYQKQLVAKSALDAEEQKTIQLRQQVEDLQGRIDGYASRRQSIEAQIARAEQEVQNRRTILGRTEITLPFDARIGAVSVDQNEFVSVGSLLFEAIDLKGVEISAQLSIGSMRKLISHLENRTMITRQFIQTGGRINESLGLDASVRLVNDMPEAVWEARVLRISESIDPTRQTLGIVVGVDNPYEKIIPGRRPPLLKGMYTAVDLYAPERPAMVIPRRAVHEGRVYIADADDRLEIRPVEIQQVQGDLVIVGGGLAAGERVIITDLIPVIAGMPLQVNPADAVEDYLRRRALGLDQ